MLTNCFRKLVHHSGFSGSIEPRVSIKFGTAEGLEESGPGHSGNMKVDDSRSGTENYQAFEEEPLDKEDDEDKLAAHIEGPRIRGSAPMSRNSLTVDSFSSFRLLDHLHHPMNIPDSIDSCSTHVLLL